MKALIRSILRNPPESTQASDFSQATLSQVIRSVEHLALTHGRPFQVRFAWSREHFVELPTFPLDASWENGQWTNLSDLLELPEDFFFLF